jgi:hypothetical protein
LKTGFFRVFILGIRYIPSENLIIRQERGIMAKKQLDNSGEQMSKKDTDDNIINYHGAAFEAFCHLLRDYVQNGDVELTDEYSLSINPPRVDAIILKKNKDVVIDTSWGKVFRSYNIIEYKSHVESAVNHSVFNKVIHGYVGFYAARNKKKLTDMTATIVCHGKPLKLFAYLEKELNYEISHGDRGIYYFSVKGAVPDKSLLIQFAVCDELDDRDLLLKALGKNMDAEMARKVITVPIANVNLTRWWDAVMQKDGEILLEEVDMTRYEELVNLMEAKGMLANREQEWRQQGVNQGVKQGVKQGEQQAMRKMFAFLSQGHSLEEAKKKFAFA